MKLDKSPNSKQILKFIVRQSLVYPHDGVFPWLDCRNKDGSKMNPVGRSFVFVGSTVKQRRWPFVGQYVILTLVI